MLIFCRECSDANDKETRKPLKELPKQSKTHKFDDVIAEGMERFCMGCRKFDRVPSTEEKHESEPEADSEEFIQCTTCKAHKSKVSLDKRKLMMWKNRNMSKRAECKICAATRGATTN